MATEAPAIAKPRRGGSRAKLPGTADAVEIAMVAAASGAPLPDAARNVLEKHAKLIDRQADLAQAQCSELKLRRVGEGVRAALWAILAIAALAVVGLVAAVVIRAARSDALVVQSFRVPPALAARGLTGEVVATQVLDKLAEMQARTDSVRAPSTYANNWEDELKIDIPNTGASASEVWKVLRGWLGKETRISGEVIDTGNGLALTARVGASPGERFASATGDLDALVKGGAELIFRQTQPYRHAIFMARDGRDSERFALLMQLSANESPMERKWAYSGLSYDLNVRGRYRESIGMADRALAIDPAMAPALSNQARAHLALGHSQAARDGWRRSFGTMRNDEYDPKVAATNRCGLMEDLGLLERDPRRIDQSAACIAQANTLNTNAPAVSRAYAALLRGDPEPALRLNLQPAPNWDPEFIAYAAARMRLSAALVTRDPALLAAALDDARGSANAIGNMGFVAASFRAAAPVEDWPLQVEALLLLGRRAEAEALIARTPADCYDCLRGRGAVARAAGNAPAAQRWYREAIRQGPRLAPAYVDYARLLSQHRRWPAAEQRFARAAELAPYWPDPLKYWGDALAAQGKGAEARKKYDAALKLAPRWAELRRARAAVAR